MPCLAARDAEWLAAGEHNNLTNIGLNIHSNMLCDLRVV